jgi:hypothetical protein
MNAQGGPTQPQTNIGKAPTKKVVSTIAVPGSKGGSINEVGKMPTFGDLVSTLGPKQVYYANGNINNNKSQDRLPASASEIGMIPGKASGPNDFNPFGPYLPDPLDVVPDGSVPLPKPRPKTGSTKPVYKTEKVQILKPHLGYADTNGNKWDNYLDGNGWVPIHNNRQGIHGARVW